jgi:hypothetical protein
LPPKAIANLDRHFGGVGARDQVDDAQKIEEFLSHQPLAVPDNILLHHRNLRSRPSASRRPKAQIEDRWRDVIARPA